MNADRGDDGFSTLEVLVAFVILSLGLVMMLQTLGQAASTLRSSRNLVSDREAGLSSAADARILAQSPLEARPPANDARVNTVALQSDMGLGFDLIVIRDQRDRVIDLALTPSRPER